VRWNVVEADADDNKYVDCAVAAGAKILVSDDKHLRILKKKVPPLVDLKTLQEYHEYLNAKKTSGIGRKRKK
jgi:predicted nucleic acid-binding protein